MNVKITLYFSELFLRTRQESEVEITIPTALHQAIKAVAINSKVSDIYMSGLLEYLERNYNIELVDDMNIEELQDNSSLPNFLEDENVIALQKLIANRFNLGFNQDVNIKTMLKDLLFYWRGTYNQD